MSAMFVVHLLTSVASVAVSVDEKLLMVDEDRLNLRFEEIDRIVLRKHHHEELFLAAIHVPIVNNL